MRFLRKIFHKFVKERGPVLVWTVGTPYFAVKRLFISFYSSFFFIILC